MNRQEEFSKWISTVEEALAGETVEEEVLTQSSSCGGCGSHDCEECFPEDNQASGQEIPAVIIIGGQPGQDALQGSGQGNSPQQQGIGMAGARPVNCPTCGHSNEEGDAHNHDDDGEIDVTMMPQNDAAFDEEGMDMDQEEMPRSGKPGVLGHIVQKYVPFASDDSGEDFEMDEATEDDPPDGAPKKTKTKYDSSEWNLDGDMFGAKPDQPLVPMGEPDDEIPAQDAPDDMPAMPTASADDTRAAMQNRAPTELMRDFMSRINPNAGGDEPELAPQDQQNAIVARTARDVPRVITTAMQATGMVSPTWHTLTNLPGYSQRHIRGMGRQVFGMFTATPLEQIKTIANVEGQGPNTDGELRAVAQWLMTNAVDLGEVNLDHGEAVPGYDPDVREYSANGVRFHVVRDRLGQYIYVYPDADARINTGQGRIGQQGQAMDQDIARLREDIGDIRMKLSLFEELHLDEQIKEAFDKMILDESVALSESSLSKLIGKKLGGQKLVHWLHSKHKLGNEADLQPQPFSERMMWKEFKRNPDNFIVVAATGGVAGIKPFEKQIKDRIAAAAQRGKIYDPGGDSTLQYQIIAFTSNGERVDPALLQPAPEAGEARDVDPTVMKARMGKISGTDTQNPDNVFNLLADQIGSLVTVYLAGGAIERGKMKSRDELGAGPNRQKADKPMNSIDAKMKLFKRLVPVLQPIVIAVKSKVYLAVDDATKAGNRDEARRLMDAQDVIDDLERALNTSSDVRLVGSVDTLMSKAIRYATNTQVGSDEYKKALSDLANGPAVQLKPILRGIRKALIGAVR